MSNKFVLYHGNCFDGMAAAWVLHREVPDATFIPVLYGVPPPDIPPGSHVVIVDFSYPRDVLEAMRTTASHLKVIDHHKTAQEALKGLDYATFDMEHSGAALAWKYCYGTYDSLPVLVKYIEDRDLWRFRLPYSDEINSFIQSFPMEFVAYDDAARMLDHDLVGARREGSAISRYKRTMVDKMCEGARTRYLGVDREWQVPVVNASMLFSEVGERLCQLFPDMPFAGYYFDRADGVRQWGLRSRGEFDVSEVAKVYGGGGHKNSAGFQQQVHTTEIL